MSGPWLYPEAEARSAHIAVANPAHRPLCVKWSWRCSEHYRSPRASPRHWQGWRAPPPSSGIKAAARRPHFCLRHYFEYSCIILLGHAALISSLWVSKSTFLSQTIFWIFWENRHCIVCYIFCPIFYKLSRHAEALRLWVPLVDSFSNFNIWAQSQHSARSRSRHPLPVTAQDRLPSTNIDNNVMFL